MDYYTLDWQKKGTKLQNSLNVVGLIDLDFIDTRFFSENRSPLKKGQRYGSDVQYGGVAQESEEAIARFISSKYNPTNYNSLHFIVTNHEAVSLELLKQNDISLFLMQSMNKQNGFKPGFGYRDGKKTLDTINFIIDSGYAGKIITIIDMNERFLKNECQKKGIISLEVPNQYYRSNLKKALNNYFGSAQ